MKSTPSDPPRRASTKIRTYCRSNPRKISAGSVKIAPADGYGERDAELIQRVPKRSFGKVSNLKPGMQFQAQTSDGHARMVTVTGIQGDMVTVDGNHPLAGEHLNFEVEITEVREATQEELEHGHVHGAGGHHH